MKTKRLSITRRLLCLFIAALCAVSVIVPSSPTASAEESLEDLRNQYDNLEEQIQKNEEALKDVQNDIKTNEQKLDDLNGQIDSIESQLDVLDERISVLNSDISSLQSSIDLATNDIDKINAQIGEIEAQVVESQLLMEETRELLLARLRENYMSGGSGSTVELLLTSDDLSSFFARRELVTSVSERDSELIAELSGKVTELDSLEKELIVQKAELEDKKAVLDSEMAELTVRQTDLSSSIDAQEQKKSSVTGKYKQVQSIINDLDKNSDAYKKAIARQRAEREALEAEIDDYIRQHGSSEGDAPDEEYENDGDMMWPVKGSTRLTATYPSYSDGSPHWGIDIVMSDGSTRGKPFYAAQGGEVIIAYNDGNWNSGFGNYCVIDHGDGTQTLYAHSDNIKVRKGQVVKKGEEIGIIGATGNVTGPHLHFEVRVKKSDGSVSRVNPLNYVSKP